MKKFKFYMERGSELAPPKGRYIGYVVAENLEAAKGIIGNVIMPELPGLLWWDGLSIDAAGETDEPAGTVDVLRCYPYKYRD